MAEEERKRQEAEVAYILIHLRGGLKATCRMCKISLVLIINKTGMCCPVPYDLNPTMPCPLARSEFHPCLLSGTTMSRVHSCDLMSVSKRDREEHVHERMCL